MSITETEADRLMNKAIEILTVHYSLCSKCWWEETKEGAILHHVNCKIGKRALTRINVLDKWLLDMDKRGLIKWKDDEKVEK